MTPGKSAYSFSKGLERWSIAYAIPLMLAAGYPKAAKLCPRHSLPALEQIHVSRDLSSRYNIPLLEHNLRPAESMRTTFRPHKVSACMTCGLQHLPTWRDVALVSHLLGPGSKNAVPRLACLAAPSLVKDSNTNDLHPPPSSFLHSVSQVTDQAQFPCHSFQVTHTNSLVPRSTFGTSPCVHFQTSPHRSLIIFAFAHHG